MPKCIFHQHGYVGPTKYLGGSILLAERNRYPIKGSGLETVASIGSNQIVGICSGPKTIQGSGVALLSKLDFRNKKVKPKENDGEGNITFSF